MAQKKTKLAIIIVAFVLIVGTVGVYFVMENGQIESPNKPNKPAEYELVWIGGFREGLARYEISDGENSKYGFMNVRGEMVIDAVYEDVNDFCNNLATVKRDGKWGYIDKDGNIVIDIVYDSVRSTFDDTMTWVEKDGVKEYITLDGTVIYKSTGKEVAIGDVCNGFFWVDTKVELATGAHHTMTYYTKDGKAFSLDGVKSFDNGSSDINDFGYAVVKTMKTKTFGGLNGYPKVEKNESELIDSNGNILDWGGFYKKWISSSDFNASTIIEFLLGEYVFFYPSSSYAKDRDKYYYKAYLNFEMREMQGHETFSREYRSMRYLGNGFYCYTGVYPEWSHNDEWSAITYKGERVFYLNSMDLQDSIIRGVTYISYKNKDYFAVAAESTSDIMFSTIIDFEGYYEYKYMFTPTSEFALFDGDNDLYSSNFSSGLLIAEDTESGLFGFVDFNGNWVIEAQYEDATDFYRAEDNCLYAVVNEDTIINNKGEVVFKIEKQ